MIHVPVFPVGGGLGVGAAHSIFHSRTHGPNSPASVPNAKPRGRPGSGGGGLQLFGECGALAKLPDPSRTMRRTENCDSQVLSPAKAHFLRL